MRRVPDIPHGIGFGCRPRRANVYCTGFSVVCRDDFEVPQPARSTSGRPCFYRAGFGGLVYAVTGRAVCKICNVVIAQVLVCGVHKFGRRGLRFVTSAGP